mmetsp:Transcript_12151/g.15916  ORF Transcript_12151/g.15916 Transcript_12151/m.15916 type:complete len:777 (-) Transcript_12151:381-2711(-)
MSSEVRIEHSEIPESLDLDVEVTGDDDLDSWALKYRAIAVIGYLSLLLALGKFTMGHWSKSPKLRRVVIPPAVVGGLIGFLCYSLLDSEPELQQGLHGGMEEIIVNLICFVFTALILGFSSSGSFVMNARGIIMSIWHEGIPMLLYSQVVLWGQTFVSLAVVCAYLAAGVEVSPFVAPLITMGLEAGRDIMPADIVGGKWTKEVVQLADSLGLVLSILLGIGLISLRHTLGKSGWLGTHYLKGRAELPQTGHREAFERGGRKETSKLSGAMKRAAALNRSHSQSEVVGPDIDLHLEDDRRPSLEALLTGHEKNDADDTQKKPVPEAGLGTHLSFVALSIFIAYATNMLIRYLESTSEFFKIHHIMSGIRLFKLAMIMAMILMVFVRRTGTVKFHANWFHRLAGLCLDLLIIAALSNIRFDKLPELFTVYHGIFAVIVLACLLWNAFVFVYLARRMFPNFWYERAVALGGDAMGHSWVGLLLVRALDPTLCTPVPLAFAYKMMIFFVPGSGGKNAIVIGLIDTVGPTWSMGLSLVVILCWLIIFQTYFRKLMPNHHSKKEKKSQKAARLFEEHLATSTDSGIELLNKPTTSDQDIGEQQTIKAELIDRSNILSDSHVEQIANMLPASETGRNWALAYSMQRDGACLRTLLYACMVKRKKSCLIVIEDSWGYVFGGYVGHPLENQKGYYGTGQSFVYTFHPSFRVFNWTGQNDLFMVSNESQLAMGGGGGFAFKLDNELDNGVSNRSDTFGNTRLSSNEFFKCLNVEVWVFEEMSFTL